MIRRKHFQKKLCASDRDELVLKEFREDSQFNFNLIIVAYFMPALFLYRLKTSQNHRYRKRPMA